MTSFHLPVDPLETVDSIDAVEYDTDAGTFRAGFDGTRDRVSLAVVAVVAAVADSGPLELPPLHSAIDTGALDALSPAHATGERRSDRVRFSYATFDVTVCSEGTIEVAPEETDRSNPDEGDVEAGDEDGAR